MYTMISMPDLICFVSTSSWFGKKWKTWGDCQQYAKINVNTPDIIVTNKANNGEIFRTFIMAEYVIVSHATCVSHNIASYCQYQKYLSIADNKESSNKYVSTFVLHCRYKYVLDFTHLLAVKCMPQLQSSVNYMTH